MNRKYDESDEFTDVDRSSVAVGDPSDSTQITYYVRTQSVLDFGPRNNAETLIGEDILNMRMANDGSPDTSVIYIEKVVYWDRNPRFVAKFRIVESLTANGDNVQFGMGQINGGTPPAGDVLGEFFGFRVYIHNVCK